MAKIPINLKTGAVVEDSDLIIGIDLGTTNSLAAYIVDGKPIAIKNDSGSRSLVPSIIHFDQSAQVIVGEAAKSKLVEDPSNTIYSIKRLMGKAYKDVLDFEKYFSYRVIDEDEEKLVKIEINGRYFSPIELSAEILKKLKSLVESQLDKKISKAVITVPAYFNDAQRQATRDAGKIAGLNVLRIINEPTAASLAYGLDQNQDQTIAVYDLGGGTFDISILQIQDGIFEVLSTHGNTFLGGDDFDRKIQDFWIEKYGLQNELENKSTGQSLRLASEEAKVFLSSNTEFKRQLSLGKQTFELELSREQFNHLTKDLIEQTLQSCKKALKDAELSVSNIDHVIMVGGSTRVPFVSQSVSQLFEKPVFDNINPDEVVALGAAVQADILSGNNKDLLLLDITPLSLGIETVGGLMDVIVPRNSKIPTSVGRNYTTSVDGQTKLKISVYQGERDLVNHNRKLAVFILNDIPPMPAGIPKIEIQFLIDADGILRVKAKELRSGAEQELEIRSQYGLSEEEMALMLIDSIKNASSDVNMKALLEAKNEANHILRSSDKFLKQHEEILTLEEKESISNLCVLLKEKVDQGTKDEINKAMEDLNHYTKPIAHKALDKVILESMKGKKL